MGAWLTALIDLFQLGYANSRPCSNKKIDDGLAEGNPSQYKRNRAVVGEARE